MPRVILLLPLQEFCDILQCPYHAWKRKEIHLRTIPNEDAEVFENPPEPSWELFILKPLSSQFILLRNPIHEILFENLCIGIIIHVAQNPCGK